MSRRRVLADANLNFPNYNNKVRITHSPFFLPAAQEDIVHEDLTVRENLVFSARLRLSAAKPLREQLAIVDDVLTVLQLRGVQHQLVGSVERRGISGGQRKRVNIGWELAAKPSVLYMVRAARRCVDS